MSDEIPDWKSIAELLFAALQPFKDAADSLDDHDPNDANGRHIWEHHAAMEITTDDLRAASRAYRAVVNEIVADPAGNAKPIGGIGINAIASRGTMISGNVVDAAGGAEPVAAVVPPASAGTPAP